MSVSRLPSPFCRVTASPFSDRHSASCPAIRSVCQALTRTSAYLAPLYSRGSDVAPTVTRCSTPCESTSRTPSARIASSPPLQVPRIVTGYPARARRAANRHPIAPVPAINIFSFMLLLFHNADPQPAKDHMLDPAALHLWRIFECIRDQISSVSKRPGLYALLRILESIFPQKLIIKTSALCHGGWVPFCQQGCRLGGSDIFPGTAIAI